MYSKFFTRKTQLGSFGKDTLIGSKGSDHLYGGDGSDLLIARGDRDFLHGGLGADVFTIHRDSRRTSRDKTIIHDLIDFNPLEGDRLDLASIIGKKNNYTFIGSKNFSGEGVEINLVRNRSIGLQRNRLARRIAFKNIFADNTRKLVVKAVTNALGSVPVIKPKSSLFDYSLQINIDSDPTSPEYILNVGGDSPIAKVSRLFSDNSSFGDAITNNIPKYLTKSCWSFTQVGVPVSGSDHYIIFNPSISGFGTSSTNTPSLGCGGIVDGVIAATGEVFGAFSSKIPLSVTIGSKLGIKTGSMVGKFKYGGLSCSIPICKGVAPGKEAEGCNFNIDPPLTGSLAASVSLGAELTVDQSGTNKEIGSQMSVTTGVTVNVDKLDSDFIEPFFTPSFTRYAVPQGATAEGIDFSATVTPSLSVSLGLGAAINDTPCSANIIQGTGSFKLPVTLSLPELSNPEVSLGATLGLDASFLKVNCGPIAWKAASWPIATFDIMEAIEGKSKLTLFGNESGQYSTDVV